LPQVCQVPLGQKKKKEGQVPPEMLFYQNVIAVIWDFDKTLSPDYMQKPLFETYGVKDETFWQEVNSLSKYYGRHGLEVMPDSSYLGHILTYVRHGIFKDLNNKKLFELGRKLRFYPGIPELMQALKNEIEEDPVFKAYNIEVEHYIVSTGLRQMIRGSEVARHVRDIWACEFVEQVAPPGFLSSEQKDFELYDEGVISHIGYALDHSTKTRAIFEINKGCNVHPEISVNASIAHKDRRVPFNNMIYIADGPSDVPVFSVLNMHGGKTYAVYAAGNRRQFDQVKQLLAEGRVMAFGEADYRPSTQTHMWITSTAREIAMDMVAARRKALDDRVGSVPEHVE
jgi:hypothetical protein